MQLKNKFYTKITLLFSATMTVMAGATIAPSLPQMASIYAHIPNSALLTKLILTVPGLFIALFAPIAGAIIDKFGRKKMIAGALLLYGAAGGAGYFIHDIYWLIGSRAVLGIAVAGVMTTGTTLMGDYFVGEERNKFMGIQGTFTALGGVFYILLGGFLADIHWKSPFLIYFSAWAVLVMVLFFIEEPFRKKNTDTEFSASASTSVAFSYLNTYGVYLLVLMHMMIFYIIPIQIPFYLKQIGILDNKYAGIAIATSTIFAAAISLAYPFIKRKLSTQRIYAILFTLNAGGYYLISSAVTLPALMAGLAVSGLGMGLMFPNTTLYLMKITPEYIRGKVMGGFSTAVFIAQFISPFAVTALSRSENDFEYIFYHSALLLLGLAVLFMLPLKHLFTSKQFSR